MAAPVKRPLYRFRFGFIYVALVALAGVAIGATAVLLNQPPDPAPLRWSAWKPNDASSEIERAREIARHVSETYVTPDGKPVTVVRATTMEYAGSQIPLLVRPQKTDDSVQEVKGQTVRFEICGLHPKQDCQLPEPVAGALGGTLLRREALELAMYALKYAPSLDNVVVTMPPVDITTKTATPRALMLSRDQVIDDLELRPLALPGTSGGMTVLDAKRIDLRTDRFLYTYQLGQFDQGDKKVPYMVVDPVAYVGPGATPPPVASDSAETGSAS